MSQEAKGAGKISVEWVIRDKYGNIKDRGIEHDNTS